MNSVINNFDNINEHSSDFIVLKYMNYDITEKILKYAKKQRKKRNTVRKNLFYFRIVWPISVHTARHIATPKNKYYNI